MTLSKETLSQFSLIDHIWATSPTEIPTVPSEDASIPIKSAYYDSLREEERKKQRRRELGIGEFTGASLPGMTDDEILLKGSALAIRSALSLLNRVTRSQDVETVEYALRGCERDVIAMKRKAAKQQPEETKPLPHST